MAIGWEGNVCDRLVSSRIGGTPTFIHQWALIYTAQHHTTHSDDGDTDGDDMGRTTLTRGQARSFIRAYI